LFYFGVAGSEHPALRREGHWFESDCSHRSSSMKVEGLFYFVVAGSGQPAHGQAGHWWDTVNPIDLAGAGLYAIKGAG
ncbi:MAG: hypothetical protein OZ932_10070, partial [Flavobacteriia bacterium]|nr:hypothetical protein [Flavobacteriia bacterium]